MAELVPLGDTDWTLVELDGEPVELEGEARAPSLTFDLEESRVAGFGGVNRLMGTLVLDEERLRFGPLATTLMAGPDAAMALEGRFLDALERVSTYTLNGRSLVLLAGDDVVARLTC